MDIITAAILIILFIIILIFSFSMGMLTPLIKKKEIGLVIIIGVILGVVGGAFFITPTLQGYPQAVGTLTQIVDGGHEIMTIELPSSANINQVKSNIEQMDGVNNVSSKGILIHTQPFSDNTSASLDKNIMYMNANLSNWSFDNKAGIINVNFTNNNLTHNLKTLKERLFSDYGVSYSYAVIELQVDAQAGSVQHITNELAKNDIVVSDVNGPVHDSIVNAQNNMPSSTVVVLFCAILSGFVTILGVYVDSIRRFLGNIKWR